MKYAVIKTGGKQYRVKEGEMLKVEQLSVEPGMTIDFSEILMIVEEGHSSVGTPFLTDAKVSAEVITHGRHKKVQIIKFRRRKHHMKRMGHRQNYTQVKITAISK